MSGAVVVITSVGLVVALAVLMIGAATLVRREVAVPWMRPRAHWKRWGWAQILLGVSLLLETVPRLAGYSADRVFALSIAAFAPLVAAVVLQARGRLPRP
jgi:hypothetical protein